ncbi:MAG: YkgJ family cysteine cluster protein [Bacteriovoracaceae bacterium]|jgi:uncharacterized protein|nr:YkgJ family cysteine cluster protein [Bacteriovoracaceae bacterium]
MTNFPEIAYLTFVKLKHDFNFAKITKAIVKRLKKHRDPAKRARLVFKEVDLHLKNQFKDESVNKLVTCKAGCEACCHTQVSVTKDEADLLSQKIVEGLEIDLEKLSVQSKVKNSSEEWYKLSYEERGCLFLDGDGYCTVYEDRPAVCRTNYVVSSAINCNTEDGVSKTVRLLNTHSADMAIVGAFQSSKENGALPYMLFKSIDNLLSDDKAEECYPVNKENIQLLN